MTTKAHNYTFKLDDLTASRLDWLHNFTEEIGVPRVHKRTVVTRAIEFYLEYLEELVPSYHVKPNHRDILLERNAIIKVMTDRESFWGSPKLPSLDLTEEDVFPTYSDLIAPKVKPKLPSYHDRTIKRKRKVNNPPLCIKPKQKAVTSSSLKIPTK